MMIHFHSAFQLLSLRRSRQPNIVRPTTSTCPLSDPKIQAIYVDPQATLQLLPSLNADEMQASSIQRPAASMSCAQ